jgi:hypothetical protein
VPQALLAFIGTFSLTLIGLGLSSFLTALAVLSAWLGGARLWLDSAVHRARRLGDWPPTPWCRGRTNRLAHVVLTALTVFFFLLVPTVWVAGIALLGASILVVSLPLSICAPVLLLVSRDAIFRHVGADRPEECWPEALDGGPQDWQPPPDLR